MLMKTKITTIDVPDRKGTVKVQVPVYWDEELEDWILTPEAHDLIERAKQKGRDPDKVFVGGFYDQELKDAIIRVAIRNRTTLSQVVLRFLIEGLEKEGIEVPEEGLMQLTWTKGLSPGLMKRRTAALAEDLRRRALEGPRRRRKRQPDGTLALTPRRENLP